MTSEKIPSWQEYLAKGTERVGSEREACDALRADAFTFSPDLVRILERPIARNYAPEDLEAGRELEQYRNELGQIFLKSSSFPRVASAMRKILEIDDILAHRSIGLLQ